jgi:hypothetical protein
MSNPVVHAERSAKKWGGQPADYLAIHQWLDVVTYCYTFLTAYSSGSSFCPTTLRGRRWPV